MGSAEQLEMDLDEGADELEGDNSDSDPSSSDDKVIELSDKEEGADDEGEVATDVDGEACLPSPPPTDSKKPKGKGKGKQAQAEGV